MQFLSRRCSLTFIFTFAFTFAFALTRAAAFHFPHIPVASFSSLSSTPSATPLATPSLATTVLISSRRHPPRYRVVTRMSSSPSSPSSPPSTLLEAMSEACTKSLGRVVQLEAASGGGSGGGGGASISAAIDINNNNMNTKYFIKSARGRSSSKMLHAEYEGVKAMAESGTIKVPNPITYGEFNGCAFVIFEYLNFCGGGGSQYELGQQLAKMHRSLSPNNQFGFHVDNTIGATPQPNLPWKDTWAEFWNIHRLGHMLKLTNNAGGSLSNDDIHELLMKTKELLSHHDPKPSLIHGDLWGGNKGFAKIISKSTTTATTNNNIDEDDDEDMEVVPVIFDPATYYGDREADIAMTYLFGGFSSDFYEGYEAEWPLPIGHEKRRTIYNLYHILNHDVLFGGGYIRQAQGMIGQILRM